MSKELSPLKALKDLCENCHKHIQSQPSKGYLPYKECPWRHISNDYCEEYETVKKSLKALEIIKKKKVQVSNLLFYLKTNACDDSVLSWYNEYIVEFDERTLTEEEFDLLKEVLL